jgi:hypothetical protein
MQNYVVYRALTPEEINECSYSLIKYLSVYNLKPPKDQTVVVYTGQPARLESYASYFHHFDFKPPVLEEGRVSTLRTFFQQYNGNVLYLDTNTYPISPLENIFNELEKGAAFVLGWRKVIPKKSGEKELRTIRVNKQEVRFDPAELNKWNDSVIGLNTKMKSALDAIAADKKSAGNFDGAMAEKFLLHHQLQQLNVKTADHAIAQYDDLKEFRDLLRKFFSKYQEESVPNQVKLASHTDAALIQQQKKEFNELPMLQKLMKRISGKHWNIRQYEKKI